jgi:hypothetical protein
MLIASDGIYELTFRYPSRLRFLAEGERVRLPASGAFILLLDVCLIRCVAVSSKGAVESGAWGGEATEVIQWLLAT